MSDAIQFLSTVVSTDATLHHLPESMEASEIVKYALVHEIMSTSKIGSYSADKCMYSCNLALKMFCTGLLQILMLAGATGYSIQQHCEVYRDA